MKKLLPILVCAGIIALTLVVSPFANAQSDTLVFDYDNSNSCWACNDDIIENVDAVTDSIVDSTPGPKFITSLQVKVKLFTCLSNTPITLRLNGHTVGAVMSSYLCSCNECDSIIFNVPFNEIKKYYLYGQKNTFRVGIDNNYGLYIDRVILIRNYTDKFDYDAGLVSVDSPLVYHCPGNANVVLKVANFGRKPFSGGDIDWTLNGVGKTGVTYTNSLDTMNGTGSTTGEVLLGSITINRGQAYELVAWASSPGGQTDSFSLNDTIRYTFYGGYKDTITVGGTAPMFSTIQDAVNDLMQYGVCGPTVISIRPGTYYEQVIIGPIPGSGGGNDITFVSENGDSSSVLISYSANFSQNYTLGLQNASNVRFQKITIEALHATYGRCVYMGGNVENINFDHCLFMGKSTSSNLDRLSVVHRNYQNYFDQTRNLVFEGCHFAFGSYGLYLNNSYAASSQGVRINRCLFDKQHRENLTMNYGSNVKITNNSMIRNSGSLYYGYGIYLALVNDSLDIINNKIYQNNGSSGGIFLNGCSGSSNRRLIIANNVVSVNSTGYSAYGVQIQNTAFADVMYNSIIYKSGSGASEALYIYNGQNLRVFNNNLANLSGNNVVNIYSDNNNCVSYLDHNNYYTAGSIIGRVYGQTIKSRFDLIDLGFDSNSVFCDPSFAGLNDLHAYHADLNGNARPDSRVITDADGKPRDATNPDIGAYELEIAGLDAGISDILVPVADTVPLVVELKNYGTTTLTDVDIDWKLNGTLQATVNWTGSLASGQTTTVSLDTIAFDGNTSYQIKAWTLNPNSGTDSLALNDTASATFYPKLHGTYTIGGSSPDFSDFNTAVTALNNRGISAPVIFKVRNGNYNEQIALGNVSGALNENDIVFESEAGDSSLVRLTFASSGGSDNYVISLNEATGVTFRKMTLKNTGTNYAWVAQIQSGSKKIRFENNQFENNDSTSDEYYRYLVNMDGNGGRDLYFENNFFNKGSRAFYCYSNYNNKDLHLVLKGNQFRKQGNYPIEINQMHHLELINNDVMFYGNTSNYVIRLISTSGPSIVSGNKIFGEGNQIQMGLSVEYYSSSDDTLMITNNFIGLTSKIPAKALQIYESHPVKIAFNNLLLESFDSNGVNATLYAQGSDIVLLNNNLVHTGKNYQGYFLNNYSIRSDYNNWYGNGTKLIYHNGNHFSSLLAYQSSTNQDAASLRLNPFYNSRYDLHASAVAIDGAGTPVAGITRDIDDETRNTSLPDIGADEFTPLPNNIAVTGFISPLLPYKADTLTFIAEVTNLGTDTIHSFVIQMKVNTDTLPRRMVSCNLPSSDTIHVNLGEYILQNNTTYDLLAYSSLPNGTVDQNTLNDTLKILDTQPALSGVYTIGGTSPDFNTFNEAVNALKSLGVADSVRFRVRAGTYNEHISIPAIVGSGARNSIIFESEDLDTGSVTLTYDANTYDSNYVVEFNGADGVTFRYMQIFASSTSNYGTAFHLQNKSGNITLEHNVILGQNTSYGTDQNSLIRSNSDNDNDLHILNNQIREGDYAIYLYGYNGNFPYNHESGLKVSGNTFSGQYYNVLEIQSFDSIEISNNQILMNEYDYNTAIYLDNVKHFDINANTIISASGQNAIRIYNCGYESFSNRSLISNNAIYMTSSNTDNTGLNIEYLYYTDILNNTVSMNNASYYNCFNLYAYYGEGNIFFNNIMHNTGYGQTMSINSSSTFDSLNYNNYYTNGTYLGYFNSGGAYDIIDWRGLTGFENQSMSVDPQFKGTTDLHVTNVDLNEAAKPFAQVMFDIDNEPRDPSNPDIGADEFSLLTNDIGVSHILVPLKPFPVDSQFVKVALKNYGSNDIYNATLSWELNGIAQVDVLWSDTLHLGDTVHVKLAKKYFDKDSTYGVKVWTSLPNGSSDNQTANDTLRTDAQYPALSGVYTIGGATPDFNTFTDAVEAMKRGGIIDSVRFDVRNGTYNEQISIPHITGASGENAIIFQSEQRDSSKVRLIGSNSSTDNYVVRLDSAEGVTFRHMNIWPNSTGNYTKIVEILKTSQNIIFTHCNLIGRVSTSTTDNANIHIYNTNSYDKSFTNLKFLNSSFVGGSYGIYAEGYSNNRRGEQLHIEANRMEDHYYASILINECNAVQMKNNIIYHTSPQYNYGYGISMNYCSNSFELTGNHIYNQEYYGVYMYSCYGNSGDTALITNNFIHNRGDGQALSLTYSGYINIYHNNINSTSNYSYTYGTQFYYLNNTKVHNNSFVHSGPGYAIYLYGSLNSCDYNNYYSAGTYLAYYSGTGSLNNLSGWQSSTGYDGTSLSVDPQYTSSTDLHVQATDLNATGKNLGYLVPTDFDGELRDTLTPDIGADEFKVANANDAGISVYYSPLAPFNAGVNKIKVFIKNFGYDTLKSVSINWSVNGVPQTTKSWTGMIKSGQSDTVTVGSYTFQSGKKHSLIFSTHSPNGASDSASFNDTLKVSDIYPALRGVYTVEGSLPDFATLEDAFTALKLGGIADTVWFKLRSGTYAYNLTLSDYPGTHHTKPVYIESLSGDSSNVVLTNSVNSGHVIFLNGADYIRFRNISFKPNYYAGVKFEDGANGIQFENCHFEFSNYYYYVNSYGIYSGADRDDSLLVRQCRFERGTYGIFLYGYSNNGYDRNIRVEKCLFNNQYNTGIYINYADAPQIISNEINNHVYSGIYLQQTINSSIVSHNKVTSTNNVTSGIHIYNNSGTGLKKGSVFNNFVAVNGSYGLYFYSNDFYNIYHNSVHNFNSNTNTRALYLNYESNVDVRNNIFAHSGGGLAVEWANSPSITQSNFNNLYTSGTNLGRYDGVNKSDLTSWKSASGYDANSISLNPSFVSNTDLHTSLSSMDSVCLPLALVTDDIDYEARNSARTDMGADEYRSLSNNMGVSAIISPANTCGLDSSVIRVRVFNYGNKGNRNVPVKYRIGSGSIVSATITDSIGPGKSFEYQFAQKIPTVINTTYQMLAWTDLSGELFRDNDTAKIIFTSYSKPDSVKSTLPSDNSTGLDYPVALSWLPSTGATKYDIYYWKYTDSKPTSPNVSNITQISYQINGGLSYGEKYNWQVISKNPQCETPGLVKSFTMRSLPDLIVEEVNAPSTAFSSTNISVSWKIKNQGSGAASGNWYDLLYLSADAVLDNGDTYLGGIQNPSALGVSQEYSQSINVKLPNGINGNYYIFIQTDLYNHLNESNNGNNAKRDTGKMVVSLTPPPDLIVSSIIRPSTVFSGTSANITYTVKNQGTGKTLSGSWADHIYLSTEKVVNNQSHYLGQHNRSGNLNVDSTYTVSRTVQIPPYISGKYFYVVLTDNYRNEYEHASEGNNTTGSDTIKVFLTPPPDLLVENVSIQDTVSNHEVVNISYDVLNEGGSSSSSGFYDQIFLSPTSTFNQATAQYVGSVYHNTLSNGDTSHVSKDFKIPSGLSGTQYLFVKTDFYDYVTEVGKENNNISAATATVVISPDLKVRRVIVAGTDTTGSNTLVKWTVENKGKGTDYQGTRNDSLYISASASWNRSQSTPLGRLRYSATLNRNDSIVKSATVRIPDGFDGNRYFFVVCDASGEIYENGLDTNNYKRSNLMNVSLAPYPDLAPTFLIYPDSANAGDLIGITYKVTNQGDSRAKANWKDRIYLSLDSVYNPSKLLTLTTLGRQTDLEKDSSYQAQVFMSLPANLTRGYYYYYFYSDFENAVYEHLDESNNIVRSQKVFIDGYPPVDLKVNCPIIEDSVQSGTAYNLSYSVTNIGQAATAVGAWNDGVYLSADTILGAGDTWIYTVQHNKILQKDSSYSVNKFITIPNGYSGNYYLIVKSDIGKAVADADTTNNKRPACKTTGGAMMMNIKLTSPPDLQITAWDVPATSTSGQPIKLKWNVKNNGTGATISGAWKDQLYLSTDYTIDNNDFLLGEKQHMGNLAVNGSYVDSISPNIPINKTGNFIVIIKTDAGNAVYEHTQEGNNTVSSITTATQAPPADLVVTSVTAPDSVISGGDINVEWKVKNQGTNPATGSLRDNIYLSADNVVDANDILLGSQIYYQSLAPSSEVTRNRTVTISGVPLGDYNVLVLTDALNNINESNDNNNTGVSSEMLNVNIPLLPIGVNTADVLTDGELIYHRIVIPDSLAGESLLITLKGDSINGNNQIYTRFGNVPSGSEFDYKYREPFAGNQDIIIPELLEGTYYLLTTGQKTGTGDQNIQLLARILPFEIRKITPNRGGNLGDVTILVEGSKLNDVDRFMLLTDSTGGNILPDSNRYKNSGKMPVYTQIIDPTLVYITLDLSGMDTGIYDLVAYKGLEEARLDKGFTVEQGVGGKLEVTLDRPGNTRANSELSMVIYFRNTGNNDMVNRKVTLVSSAGAPIALKPDDLSKNYQTLIIPVQSNTGPPGRLGAGESSSVTVYTNSSGAMGFIILK